MTPTTACGATVNPGELPVMATESYGCKTERPCTHGPIPTILYTCADTQEDTARQLAAAESYATNRAWKPVATVIETMPGRPLPEREGWLKVESALSLEEAGIAVV